MDVEVWKDVVGFDGRYQVSSHGRVLSNIGNPKILAASDKGRGYLGVNLSDNGVVKTKTVHSIVAEAFIGPRPDGLVVDHRDEDKRNNHSENLRYITNIENIRRSVKSDTMLGVTRVGKRFKSLGRICGKTTYLGMFDTELEANQTFLKALECS